MLSLTCFILYNKLAAASNSSTGISPYLILMRIPHNAVRAFNAGVSLFCTKGHGLQITTLFSDIIIFAHCKRSWRICHTAQFDTNVPICCLYCISMLSFPKNNKVINLYQPSKYFDNSY